MSAVLPHTPPRWREPHDSQRWPLAAGAALVLEVAIIGALLWLAEHDAAPPPPAPMQIVLDTPRPAIHSVTPRAPAPPPPKPLPKPIPKPVVEPKSRPVPPKIAPPPAQSPPPLPVATPKVVAPPSPVPDTKPAMPVVAPSPPPKRLPPARDVPNVASIKANFEAKLRTSIQAAMHYPQAARLMRLSGKSQVRFTFAQGRATAIAISRSSGDSSLDQAAINAVRNAKYPPIPSVLANKVMHFQLWVIFDMSK